MMILYFLPIIISFTIPIFLFIFLILESRLFISSKVNRITIFIILIISILSSIICIGLSFLQIKHYQLYYHSLFIFDKYTLFSELFILSSYLVIILILIASNVKNVIYLVTSIGIASSILIFISNSIFIIFFGIEGLSYSLYIASGISIMGSERVSKSSSKAILNYYIFGSLASIFFLLGSILLYGYTGSQFLSSYTNIIQSHIPTLYIYSNDNLMEISVLILILSLMMKLGIVPLYLWIIRVYENLSIRLFLYTISIPKIVYILLIVRIYIDLFYYRSLINIILYSFIFLSFIVTIIALLKRVTLNRVLSFSSLFNIGYILMGIYSMHSISDVHIVIKYIIYYFLTFFTILFFFSICESHLSMSRLVLFMHYKENKIYFIFSIIFFYLLAGLPFSSLFLGKISILRITLENGTYLLPMLSLLSSIVVLYGYFNFLNFDFSRNDISTHLSVKIDIGIYYRIVLLFLIVINIYLFCWDSMIGTFINTL